MFFVGFAQKSEIRLLVRPFSHLYAKLWSSCAILVLVVLKKKTRCTHTHFCTYVFILWGVCVLIFKLLNRIEVNRFSFWVCIRRGSRRRLGILRGLSTHPTPKLEAALVLSWSAVYWCMDIDMERMVEYRICRVRDVTFLTDGIHDRVGESH